jgi:hypothetical protein
MFHVDSLFLDLVILNSSWLVSYYIKIGFKNNSLSGSWFEFKCLDNQYQNYWFVSDKKKDRRDTCTFTELVSVWKRVCIT